MSLRVRVREEVPGRGRRSTSLLLVHRTPTSLVLALAALLAVVIAGCGSDSSGSPGGSKPPAPAKAADFPQPGNKTLAQLKQEIGKQGPVLAPAVSQLQPGTARFGFALFDRARAQIADAPVVLYTAPKGGGKVRGPIPARWESLAVKPQFQSRSVASDPDAAKAVYVADLKFARPGAYDVLAVARLDKRLVAADAPAGLLQVTDTGKVPNVGDKAPVIDTPTKAQVGDVKKIDTRLPPSNLHEQNFKDVVGKKPVILIFATPALCQSRVCGPVVDIAEQLKTERGKDADFIHQEIYKDNQINKGFRPQVRTYHLPTEPWVFAIDRRGRVAARLEGPYSVAELEKAVDAAVK